MKHTTKLILVILFSLFLSLLSSCGFMVIEVTPTPTPQTPTETLLPPTNTPSKTATASKTATPSKTPVPTSTPTPDVPLSADGPWLVYQRNYFKRGGGDVGSTLEEFTILNQDGSGMKMIEPFSCNVNDFLMSEEGAANHMIENRGAIFLFRPEQVSGCLVHRSFRGIGTTFSRQEKGGLLASIYRPGGGASPELIVYELPAGKIRARQPLIQCPEEETACQENKSGLFEDVGRPVWSPNGRYLAFTAVRNSISSDLYVLDSQDGSVRQLTSGPDWVGGIWWSPDGRQILMEEIVIPWNDELKREDYFYLGEIIPSSLWSVSVSDNQLRRLYSIEYGGGCCSYESAYHVDGPWIWLDDKRFLIYEGASGDYDMGPARNLRLVDTSSGETRMLADFGFYEIALDEVHDVFAASLPYSIDEEYEQGVYLVSLRNSTVRHLDLITNIKDWDEKTGLFVTSDPCKDDPEKYSAFNYLGELSCVSRSSWPASPVTTAYPAPDGKAQVSVQDGIWLKVGGADAVQVSPETAANVIWCPDSSCFFFFVKQEDHTSQLYHVSLSDLTNIKLVDEGLQNVTDYWWLEKDDSQP
jgi:hypothetical protein